MDKDTMQIYRILLVDDEFDSAEIIEQLLTYYGAQVQVVGDGDECLKVVADYQPDIIVMDLAMPRLDGWRTLQELRQNPNTCNVPVVAVTAYHSTTVAHNANNAGFDAYFAKPLNVEVFVKRLLELLRR
jgi:CheY-like chemotaxis protein